MRLSDIITQRILELLDESEKDTAEIRRNELASILGCVPSQINYVLDSRFTPENGFIVESKRGGGGYIRIIRVRLDHSSALMHIINSIGYSIDLSTAQVVIRNCYDRKLIKEDAALVMKAVLSNSSFKDIPVDNREKVRATMLKQMFLTQL